MPTPLFQLKVEPALKDWLQRYAAKRQQTPSQVVRELAVALQEGRIEVCPPPAPTEVLSLRMDKDTQDWLTDHAKEHGSTRGPMLRDLLDALRMGQLDIESSLHPDPFPADEE